MSRAAPRWAPGEPQVLGAGEGRPCAVAGLTVTVKVSAAQTREHFCLLEVGAPAGWSGALPADPADTLVVQVLAGVAHVRSGDDTWTVTAGCTWLPPPGGPHLVAVGPDGPLGAIVLATPGTGTERVLGGPASGGGR